VERYVARAGIDYPVYYDPELKFEDSLGVTELPLIVVFDAEGRLVRRSARLDDETKAAIRALVPQAASRCWPAASPWPGPRWWEGSPPSRGSSCATMSASSPRRRRRRPRPRRRRRPTPPPPTPSSPRPWHGSPRASPASTPSTA